ncbi:hypothetical protein CDAR_20501 [Caerostris darwini]|nr:hypothetical protein CDAR_20501 [Caerostris darwini]
MICENQKIWGKKQMFPINRWVRLGVAIDQAYLTWSIVEIGQWAIDERRQMSSGVFLVNTEEQCDEAARFNLLELSPTHN